MMRAKRLSKPHPEVLPKAASKEETLPCLSPSIPAKAGIQCHLHDWRMPPLVPRFRRDERRGTPLTYLGMNGVRRYEPSLPVWIVLVTTRGIGSCE